MSKRTIANERKVSTSRKELLMKFLKKQKQNLIKQDKRDGFGEKQDWFGQVSSLL
jgi:hypothetical protein